MGNINMEDNIISRGERCSLEAKQRIAHIGTWEWDIVNDHAIWSDETYRIFGFVSNKLKAHRQNFLNLLHPGDKARVDQALSNAVNGTKEYDLEYRIVLPDKTEKIIHALAQVIRTDDGKPVLMRGTVHDITERKHIENMIRESEEQYRTLVENSEDVIVRFDRNYRHIFVNSQAEKVTGLKKEQLLGKSNAELGMPEENVREWHANLETVFKTRQSVRHNFCFSGTMGLQYFTSIVIPEFSKKTSQVETVLVITREITELKRAEELLRTSEERYRGIVENQTEYVDRYLPGGILTYVNDALANMVGIAPQQLLGKSFYPFVHDEDRAVLIRSIESLTFEHPFVVLENRVRLPDGTVRWHQWTHRALFEEDGKFREYQSVGRDITDQKNAQETIREYSIQLMHIEEDLRSKLSTELHDEIAQDLTALGMNLSIIYDTNLSKSREQIGSQILNAQKILQKVNKSIRNIMAELRPPVIDDFGLSPALKWYSESFSSRTGIAVVLQMDDPFRRLSKDREIALFRICQEALTNIAKYARSTHVVISLKNTGDKILFSVSDDGVGFDPVDSRPNSGWGLAIMRDRAESIGGLFRLLSTPGRGTIISVEFSKEL